MPRHAIPGVVAATLWGFTAQALSPAPTDSAKLLRQIDRLPSVARVLYVAAHPDDENTRLLSWLVDHERVRAAYLSLTRGEGGQNLIGSEQGPLLGIIRTQELLAARGVDGAEQMFGLERDFGYSKSSDETLRIWGRDEALGDVVWAIRRFQPDVIVTRFSPDDHETHGHHTASAMLALEAFKAAADPKAYPEQLQWAAPWQAQRIVWNKGVFGPAKPDALVGFQMIDVGDYDALLGESYPEIAARSRTMHKSQGFGSAPQRGPTPEYFKLLAGEPFKESFLEGVTRELDSAPLKAQLEKVRTGFDVRRPAASIPGLLTALDAVPDAPWAERKRQEISEAIAACAGLFVDANAADPRAIPGGELKVTLTAINRSAGKWSLRAVRLGTDEAAVNKELPESQPVTVERTVTLPTTTATSQPYWLVNPPSAGRWTVKDQVLVGLPEQPPPMVATFSFSVAGHPLTLTRPVGFTWTDPVMGERRRPLEVLPRATLTLNGATLMFPDAATKELRVTVRATKGAVAGTVSPKAPEGFSVTPASLPFSIAEAGAEQTLHFQVKPPAKLPEDAASSTGTLVVSGSLSDGTLIDRGVVRVDHSHIPIQTLTPLAEMKLVRFNMKRAFTRIGYIPGAGDEVAAALQQVGYDVTVLTDEVLAKGRLDVFQAIVVGVRAFNVNEAMASYHERLMDYVFGGGTLVVQYNTQNRLSKITSPIGPYPFTIAQDRVTDETAAVERAPHAIFKAPNRIVDSDFNGWVQERGIYFAKEWDPKYVTPISMHDPGETPKQGSLLIGAHGRGTFIYTGLVFFRELPAGVPGAFRLFANLLSHAR